MDAHQRSIHRRKIAQHISHMLLVVQQRHVSMRRELAIPSGDACRPEMLNQFLMAATVADQVGDRDEVEVVLDGEDLQVGHSSHRPVVVHDLAQHADRLTVGQSAQVNGGRGVTGPLEDPAGSSPQRKDVPRSSELGSQAIPVG